MSMIMTMVFFSCCVDILALVVGGRFGLNFEERKEKKKKKEEKTKQKRKKKRRRTVSVWHIGSRLKLEVFLARCEEEEDKGCSEERGRRIYESHGLLDSALLPFLLPFLLLGRDRYPPIVLI
ncbi:hypothetical protein QBC44DRAFT_330353, partial [Cladorrhinum sp. PSN332]